MAYPLNALVAEIDQINFQGNVTPHHWYRALTFANGKPNAVAVALLSEIVYWYRASRVRDEGSGRETLHRKFKGDLLQKSTKALAEQFGFTVKQVKDALRLLEEKGLIIRHFRTVRYGDGLVSSNVQFIELVPEAIKRLQKIPTLGHPCPDPGTPTSQPKDVDVGTYTETTTENTESNRQKEPVCEFSDSVDSVSSSDDQVSQHDRDEALRLHNAEGMREFGCDESMVKQYAGPNTQYDQKQVYDARYYTHMQCKSGAVKKNKHGYLRDAIENARCWKDKGSQ
jgi:hypothetical protein